MPGKPQQSKLVEHIFSTDPDEIMPPPKSRKVLSSAQKELLRQELIEAGFEPAQECDDWPFRMYCAVFRKPAI